jgi:hypothetical protein
MTKWKPVHGYDNNYSISDDGRVRRDTTRTCAQRGTFLKEFADRDGYTRVALSLPGRGGRQHVVHRLVWEAFHEAIPKGLQINHINGKRQDNRLENLELVTCSENIRHAIQVLGRDYGGANNPSARLTPAEVVEMRKEVAQGYKRADVAIRYGITMVMLRNITTGKSWTSAGGPITPSRALARMPHEVLARLGPRDVAEAVRRHRAGESAKALACEYEVTATTILNWAKGRTRRG